MYILLQVLSLAGVSQTFTDQLPLAENSLKQSLSLLEGQGIGMEVKSCHHLNAHLSINRLCPTSSRPFLQKLTAAIKP